ncbi:MAG TPA: hypothetical protein VFX52_01600 [Nocardioidaceae bacterium]|nr:hypothetical protein [Nocardioidaceae bacterium]
MPTTPRFTSEPLLGHDWPLALDRPFTTRQALDAGVTRRVLERLLRREFVRRMVRGVFVAAQQPDSLALRAAALALVAPPGAVVVDWTAAWLHVGLLRPGDHLLVPPVSLFLHAGKGRLRNALVSSGERTFLPEDLCRVGDVVATTPLRTAWDLGRLSNRDLAIGALDKLLRDGGFSRERLVAGVERFRRQRGVCQLRALAPIADARSESPGESVLRLRWLDVGAHLPPPEPQVPVLDDWGRVRCRLDLGVESLRFAAEYDGEDFHTEQDRKHDEERRAWLREARGWTIVVARRESVFGPKADIEQRLCAGVDDARRRLGEFRPTRARTTTRRL